jgi:hypothetical protein
MGGLVLKWLGYFTIAIGKGLFMAILHPALGILCLALSIAALAILISGNFSLSSILLAGGVVGVILGILYRWIAGN